MSCVLEVHPCVRRSTPIPPPLSVPGQRKSRAGITRCIPSVRRLTLTLLCSGLAYGFVSSGVAPYVQAHRLNQEAAAVCRQIDAAKATQASLERRVADLQTTEGQQNEARRYGWVLKGEIAISCPAPDSALSHESDAEFLAVPVPPRPPLLQRLRHAVEW